jgi:hypothetical protein
MANTLEAENFPADNIRDILVLDADVAAGSQTVVAKSSGTLASGDYLYLSSPGSQTAEKVQVSGSPTATTVSLASPARYLHRRGETATAPYGDQIQFMYSANVDGSVPGLPAFQILQAVDIDPSSVSTAFVDTAASVSTDPTSRWYAYVYRNSGTGATTDINDAVPSRGGDYGHYCSLERIRSEAGFKKSNYITDQDIEMQRQRAEEEINGYLSKMTTLPLAVPLPQMVSSLAVVLAAGYLMLVEYGVQADTKAVARNGQAKVDWAIRKLDAMLDGRLPLLDVRGVNITSYSDYGNFPTDTTSPVFTIGKIY